MKKPNRFIIHSLFTLAYFLLVVIIMSITYGLLAGHEINKCNRISSAEKGVTQSQISYCKDLGLYQPTSNPVKSWPELVMPAVGFALILIILCIMAIYFLAGKHYKILNKNK